MHFVSTLFFSRTNFQGGHKKYKIWNIWENICVNCTVCKAHSKENVLTTNLRQMHLLGRNNCEYTSIGRESSCAIVSELVGHGLLSYRENYATSKVPRFRSRYTNTNR